MWKEPVQLQERNQNFFFSGEGWKSKFWLKGQESMKKYVSERQKEIER